MGAFSSALVVLTLAVGFVTSMASANEFRPRDDKTLEIRRMSRANVSLLSWRTKLAVPPERESVVPAGSHYLSGGTHFVESIDVKGRFLSAEGATGQVMRGDERLIPEPPSDHWVFALPNADQTKSVSISVSVFDHERRSVPQIAILAFCKPWDFRVTARTDQSGRAVIRGPVGDWTFYASGSMGAGRALLAAVRDVRVAGDVEAKIVAVRQVSVRFVTQRGEPFPTQVSGRQPAGSTQRRTGRRRGAIRATEPASKSPQAGRAVDVSFVLADLPIAVDEMRLGRIEQGTMWFSTTPGLKGYLWLSGQPDGGSPGYAILHAFVTGGQTTISVDLSKLGRLSLKFAGYHRGEARASVGIQWDDKGIREVRVPVIVPPMGCTCSLMVTPGVCCVTLNVPNIGVFVPHRLEVGPGIEHTLEYGGSFEARLNVRKWPTNMIDLWFDVLDNKGNYLLHPGIIQAKLKIVHNGQIVYDGSVERCGGRWFELDHQFGPLPARTTQFTYTASSDLLGTIDLSGQVPTDQKQWLVNKLLTVYQSPHFVFRFRENRPEVAQAAATSLEAAFQWLTEGYGGPIRTPGGRPLEILAWTPVGVGAAGGNAVRIQIYSAYDFDNTGRVLFHELGHIYIGHPPHHAPIGMDKGLVEAVATILADYCIRTVAGERAFHETNGTVSQRFFQWILSGRNADSLPLANRYEFIQHYLHMRYGQKVNQDFFLALCADKGNLGKLLPSADFLADGTERAATAYSCLTGDNIAWLFRWAGLDVDDKHVDQAVKFLQERHVILP